MTRMHEINTQAAMANRMNTQRTGNNWYLRIVDSLMNLDPV